MKISWVQIGMAICYMLLLVCVGLYMSRKVKNSSDYWIGGREIGPISTKAFLIAQPIIASSGYYRRTTSVLSLWPWLLCNGEFFKLCLTGFVIFVLFAPKMRAISERVDAVSLSGFMAVRYRSTKLD